MNIILVGGFDKVLNLTSPNFQNFVDEARNDLYIMLVEADLHGGKSSDGNIEARICAVDNNGVIENVRLCRVLVGKMNILINDVTFFKIECLDTKLL